ncbi:MAG: hypothetical protein EB072_20100, partial [Betaproteobacteria bacterium]|nr:hypothetical protein [Betaproteobacteria bacterium]
ALGLGSGYWAGGEELGALADDTLLSPLAGQAKGAEPHARGGGEHAGHEGPARTSRGDMRYTDAQTLKQVLSAGRSGYA